MTQDNRWDNNKNALNDFTDNSVNTYIIPAEKIKDISSILADIFPQVSNIILEYQDWREEESYQISFEIEKKISYNEVYKYKTILEEYWSYIIPVDAYLNLLDTNTPWVRLSFLKNIRKVYLDVLFELNTENEEKISFIKRVKWDSIIEGVLSKIYNAYILSPNRSTTHSKEDIQLAIIVIICKAFIECKILENPNL
jgi:hypothetical protein